ncbi:MAG TPA: MarR family winged helix-turn-helix transcriptional regulator, partial [Egibacteraceae bacterium]|nr:MarR family winged helix-turn-helix transcriptional regulator [Egibacteraceae bacterium]
GLLDTLQACDLVRRSPHRLDRRRTPVVLTDGGRRLVGRLLSAHYRLQRTLLADLSPEERELLVALLGRIRGVAPAPQDQPRERT